MSNYSLKISIMGILLLFLFHPMQTFGFGKNKVQYKPLSWSVMNSEHFNLYFHENLSILPEISNLWIENSYRSISNRFEFSHKKPLPLIIYGNPSLFAQTNIITEILPDGVGGFTELFKTRIVLPFNGSYNELRHVLHHELVHAFIFGMVFDQFGGSMFSDAQIPLWFNEGLAEFLSSGWNIESDQFIMEQTLNSTVPLPGPELGGFLAYKGGQSFLFFLHSSRGDSTFTRFLRDFKRSRNVSNSIQRVYNISLEELGKEWHKELKRLYWPEIGKREDPLKKSTAVTSHLLHRDHFNLRPKLSPDGSKVAFFSDRRDYTRILITDRKGKILQEISQSGYGGYFESFHPFRSGICWSPDGTSLVFITGNNGTDEIRIVDIQKKELKKRIIPHIQNISSPDWSADGKFLTFCGIKEGKNDVFLYNLQNDSLIQLTNSIQFEDDPHFSPQGGKVLISIQDTCGNAEQHTLAYGSAPSNLATIDVKNGNLEMVTQTPWNEKQAAYSSDGKKIIFISDKNGLENLYIAPIDTLENARALTDYIGGCSYPDWTKDGSVVYCLFQNQGWDIYLIEKAEEKLYTNPLAPTSWIHFKTDSTRSFFNQADPIKKDSLRHAFDDLRMGRSKKKQAEKAEKTIQDSSPSAVSQSNKPGAADTVSGKATSIDSLKSDLKKVAETDTPAVNEHQPNNNKLVTNTDSLQIKTKTIRPYRIQFTPDLIAFGLGISNYYSPAGQALLSFSDLLGDHQITVALDIQGKITDYLNAYASYIYLKHRIDLGIGGYFSRDYTYLSIYGDRLSHDTEYGGFFLARYPFSMYSRLDLEVFGRHLEREPLDSLHKKFSESTLLPSLRYTFDNIVWGLTGPVNGIRATAKILVSPPFNFVTEHFASFDADIRAYMHIAKRFVWANKFFAGASIPLGDSVSARRYFLGGNENWFSYNINEEEYQKNLQYAFFSDFVTPFRGFNYLSLTGTRVAVLNSEFRFPFIRELSIAWPLPMEIRYVNGAIFADIGNAWDRRDNEGSSLPDKIYAGFGFGLRADLGIFILRYDRGWPTDFHRIIGAPINYFSLGAEF